MIYFVQSVNGGPVKIGFTDNLETRLKALRWEFRSDLAVLATMNGDRSREREIHERFFHLRFPGTEQFRPAADLMEFIGLPLLVSANPDATEVMPSSVKKLIFQMRWSEEFGAWLKALAEFDATDTTEMIERAVAAYARAVGFTVPRPRR